jgi:hypothetical protein
MGWNTVPENSTLEYWYSKIIIAIVYVYAGLANWTPTGY